MSVVLLIIGGAICALNFYLSFLRLPLLRWTGHSVDRFISGFPLIGTVLVVIAWVCGLDSTVAKLAALLSVLIDTGGPHWFLLSLASRVRNRGGSSSASTANAEVNQTPDDPPVSYADLRALFERLEDVSSTGYPCDHTFAQTRRLLSERELCVEEMIRWLGENGAGCDCEVIFNVEQQWGERVGFVPKQ